jgi:hypothetical protein
MRLAEFGHLVRQQIRAGTFRYMMSHYQILGLIGLVPECASLGTQGLAVRPCDRPGPEVVHLAVERRWPPG